jgi:hypothetical protein
MALDAPTKVEQGVGPQSAVGHPEPSVGMAWRRFPRRTFQRLSEPAGAGSGTDRAPTRAKATLAVTAKAGAQSMKPPKLMT